MCSVCAKELHAVKDNEIKRLRDRVETLQNDLLDALDVKNGNGPTALSTVVVERDLLRARVVELEAELREQSRLLGMGGEREARLMAMIAEDIKQCRQ